MFNYDLGKMFIVNVIGKSEVNIGDVVPYKEGDNIYYLKIKEKVDSEYIAELIGINMYFVEMNRVC